MKKFDLDVEERKESGKADIGRLRRSGSVPGIVYGEGAKALSIKLDKKKLIHFIHRIGEENILTNLKIKGEKKNFEQLVILREIQYDPVTEDIIHLDFQRVSLKKKITSEVPIILKGESEGVKTGGGILDHALRAVEVECLPGDMPEHIEIDISGLKIHDSIHVKDLPLPAGVTMLTDMERSVLSVLPPRKIEIEEEVKEVEEPELIGKEGEEEVEGEEAEEKKEEAGKEKKAEPGKEKKAEPGKEQGKEKKEEPKHKEEKHERHDRHDKKDKK